MRKYTHLITLSVILTLGGCGTSTNKKTNIVTKPTTTNSQDTSYVTENDTSVAQINSGKSNIIEKKNRVNGK